MNKATDWIGWSFCELSFRGHELQDRVSPNSKSGWFGLPYRIGCWFYSLFDRDN